ncbi:MAG: hypothetical protein JSV88_01800 [Candidatus Aminicenantes bacterium]|nr:MAG: hypothetical protein JSV88_01800 [Candidatus Aminicenantes bacterium]
MKRLVLLVSVVLVIGVACDSARNWELFESDDGWFRIQFPGKPEVDELPTATPLGTIDIHMFSVNLRNGAYGVGYCDFPEVEGVDMESAEFIELLARGSFTKLGTGQYSKKEIDFEGYPGLEAEGEVRKGTVRGLARIRYYVVNERIYVLEVVGETSFVSSGNTDKFFNSFQLIYEDE